MWRKTQLRDWSYSCICSAIHILTSRSTPLPFLSNNELLITKKKDWKKNWLQAFAVEKQVKSKAAQLGKWCHFWERPAAIRLQNRHFPLLPFAIMLEKEDLDSFSATKGLPCNRWLCEYAQVEHVLALTRIAALYSNKIIKAIVSLL